MSDLIVVGLAGFAAAMVDGSLGMGFGPTSSSILLSSGLSPAAVSATVNIAKVASGTASGIANWRFGNIDKRLVLKLAVPGCIGAVLGATVLANVDGKQLRPYLAILLLLVSARILLRFRNYRPPLEVVAGSARAYDTNGITAAGVAGGVTNSLVGAWGPVVTPFLLHKRVPPRTSIGSVNTAEVAVAMCAAGSLLGAMGKGDLDKGVVLAMLIGGVLAAPIAAWAIRFLRPRAMGLAVAGVLMFTNTRDLVSWRGLGPERWYFYGLIVVVVGLAALSPQLSARRRPAPTSDELPVSAAV